jgi:hypothetical protein
MQDTSESMRDDWTTPKAAWWERQLYKTIDHKNSKSRFSPP